MRTFVSALAGCIILGTGALAQDSGISITGLTGEVISVTPQQAYRALGDRIVTGDDVIGNNARNWNQVGTRLPMSRIEVALLGDSDEAKLLYAVRIGCEQSSGNWRACEKVGLRKDRLIRQGGEYQYGLAQFDPQVTTKLAPIPRVAPPPPPPSPAPAVKYIAVPMPQPPRATSVPARQVTSIGSGTISSASQNSGAASLSQITSVELPPMTAMKESVSGPIYASRLFVGRDSFPPEFVAAYGILAFPTKATRADVDRYVTICEAFFSALITSGDIAANISQQMVTVWPVDDRKQPSLTDDLNTALAGEDSCAKAVKFYDLQIARGAIGDAMQTGIDLAAKRGPFLLAWAPAGTKGRPDAVVLAADLSNVENASDAKEALSLWRDKIEGDPTLWQNGFSVEGLRTTIRQIVNRYGKDLLSFFGG